MPEFPADRTLVRRTIRECIAGSGEMHQRYLRDARFHATVDLALQAQTEREAVAALLLGLVGATKDTDVYRNQLLQLTETEEHGVMVVEL